MNIKQEQKDGNGAFFIEDNDERIGEIVYSEDKGRITIHHTEVSKKLQGKGAGKQLVGAVVNYARKNNLKVIPMCSFAKSVIASVKDYQDVL